MKKVYYLSSCSTCKWILSEIDINDFELQDIKSEPISDSQINEMAKLSGSFESLFSRKAVLYREMKLSEKNLTEKEYRGLILENYTFLKKWSLHTRSYCNNKNNNEPICYTSSEASNLTLNLQYCESLHQ